MNVYLGELYKEVEYIQSSGTQYIDTGVYVNPDYKVEIKYQNVTFTDWGTLFGTRNGTNARFLLRYSPDASVVTAQRSTAYNVSTENYDNSSYYDHNTRIVRLDRYFYIDNNLLKTFSASTSTTAFPYSLYLFSLNSQGSPVNYGVYKIYYCKIYNNSGTLVRDFVPCYRVSDNEIGLFDKVNNKFYANAGTGTFTKGNDVKVFQPELKNAYIGEYVPPYLCFTANEANSTVKLNKNGSPTAVTLETSTDGSNWSTYTFGTDITLSNIGDKVYWRNTSETTTGFGTDAGNYYRFVMTGSISGSGDVNYLLNKNSTTTVSTYCFYYLFNGCKSLTTPPQLPATTLANYCYRQMFSGCTSLTTAPSLPATTLYDNCYQQMFNGCTSLTKTPELPSTTLANYCYYYMFNGCTGLTSAPALPATTLGVYCYHSMFNGCTNLITLPKLPATTLSDYCYSQMFYGCSKIKLSSSQTGEYQTAYRIPSSGTGTTGSISLSYMFTSTGGTFTGAPSINTTYYTSNTVV